MPPPRLGSAENTVVSRLGLLEGLHGVDESVHLIVIVAPTGYGKTTLLVQWAAEDDRPCAWLNAVSRHDDPVVLLHDVAVALQAAGVVDPVLARLSAAVRTAGPDDAVASFLDALGGLEQPVLVVLDDLHQLRSRASLDLVVDLAQRLPRGSHVALASQRWPRSRLARLRREGRCVELTTTDLVFTRTEAAEVLDRAGIRASPDVVTELLDRTEGWPAGLVLALPALTAAPDVTEAARQVSGDNHAFVQYFKEEVLSFQSVEANRFLLRTAVLHRMCASLCDVALNVRGSAAWLTEVDALNLFVVAEDDRGEWFRYHRLFGEMLRSELRRREPGEDLKILRRAASWYEERSDPETAIAYALAGHGEVTAARLIAANMQHLNSQGRLGDVRRWLDDLHEEAIEQYPPIAVIGTWVWAFLGDAPRARRMLRIAESATFEGPLPDGSVSLASGVARARAALAPDGVDVMLEDAQRAVRLEEPSGRRFNTLSAVLLGSAYMLTGDAAGAVREYERAAYFAGPDEQPGMAFALAQRALIACDDEDWPVADLCSQESFGILERSGLLAFGPCLVTYLARARVAIHRGETALAWENVRRGLALYRRPSPVALPWLAVQCAVHLGRILVDLGDLAAAGLKATEARRHMTILPTAGTLTQQVDELDEAIAQAHRHLEAVDGSQLTKAELRVLQLLPTHLSLSEISDLLVVSRNTVKSQVSAIYRKLDATTRAEAVRKATAAGLLD